MARARLSWLRRRWVLVAVLVVLAFAPAQASGAPSAGCAVSCGRDGAVLWARPLPGAWTAASEALGTVPAATGRPQPGRPSPARRRPTRPRAGPWPPSATA